MMKEIYISTNATNGEVLCTLFPNITVEECDDGYIWTDIDDDTVFSNMWWNSLYKESR